MKTLQAYVKSFVEGEEDYTIGPVRNYLRIDRTCAKKKSLYAIKRSSLILFHVGPVMQSHLRLRLRLAGFCNLFANFRFCISPCQKR
jgi:hypothetical protein